MKNIYCISGLAADHSMFQRISIEGYNLVPLPWVPFDKEDTLKSYSAKMAGQIKEENPIIIGLSFGGMIAVEIGKIVPCQKIFLVSSIKTSTALSSEYSWVKPLLKWAPSSVFNTPNFYVLDRMGAETDEDKALLTNEIQNADPAFVTWCIKAILNWDNDTYPPGIIHIHGKADKIISPKHVEPDYWIEGGTHLLIYNRATEVNSIIAKCLRQ
jgi:pimeloyl-ACP methyl ester carboxylesterase